MTPLRQRMLEDRQVRNLSPHTQRAYIENVARFARHFGRSPADLGPEEIRTYQVHLVRERRLAPSSIEIAVCALRFRYKVTLKKPWSFDDLIPAPKKPRRLPVVLSPDEVALVLNGVASPKHRVVLTTCYAAGRRISEAVRLRPTDIDSRRMVIRVEQGKGQRDRYVMLSPTLLGVLRDWWRGNRHRTEKLARCRQLLEMPPPPVSETSASTTTSLADYRDRVDALTGVSLRVCPICHDGHMIAIVIDGHALAALGAADTS